MAKSAYSLILSDEVIRAVDMVAGGRGVSRSALVNEILAQHLDMSTHQQRTEEILAVVLGNLPLRGAVSPGGTLTMRTALQYKYNPQLSYIVELYDDEVILGELRVAVRSQNEALLTYINLFFKLWSNLEQRHLSVPPNFGAIEQRRYLRTLRRPFGEGDLGAALAAYVELLDSCIKAYFHALSDAQRAVVVTERTYLQGLENLGLAAEF